MLFSRSLRETIMSKLRAAAFFAALIGFAAIGVWAQGNMLP
jgi:hypothetical protein